MIFQTLLLSRVTYRPAKKTCRALSDCEIQPFDERRIQFGGDRVEGRVTVLESMMNRPGIRVEGLPASPTPVSTTFPQLGLVEAAADDASGTGFS